MTQNTAQQWAHDLAPEPYGRIDRDGAALATLRYHVARSLGFHAAAEQLVTTDGAAAARNLERAIEQWRLARAWSAMLDQQDPDTAAQDVALDASTPSWFADELRALCDAVGIDPTAIRPYGLSD